MALTEQQHNSEGSTASTISRLARLDPPERADLVLALIDESGEAPLDLSTGGGLRANLDEIDLSPEVLMSEATEPGRLPPRWNRGKSGVNLSYANLHRASLRNANLQYADLSHANLGRAAMGKANLQAANLDGASLAGADLAGANLAGAIIREADLSSALLEETVLRNVSLRFALMTGAVLEAADLQGADLLGARMDGATLIKANMQGALLNEVNLANAQLSGANLKDCALSNADLHGANLHGVDLQGAVVSRTNFEGAKLSDAQLQGINFTNSNIKHIWLGGARIEKAQLEHAQLGGALGEELAQEYEGARRGYLALERNFLDNGDQDAANWAYVRKRRMQKLEGRKQARSARLQHHWREMFGGYLHFVTDQIVEWISNYGMSIGRVLMTMLLVSAFFTVIYGITGSVVRVTMTPTGIVSRPAQNLLDLLTFSLAAMTASARGGPAVGLVPRDDLVNLLTSIQSLVSFFLTGLLGFVVASRIRR